MFIDNLNFLICDCKNEKNYRIIMQSAFIKILKNGSILSLLETNVSTEKMIESLNWEQSKLESLNKIQSEKKKKEWLGVRLLLCEIFKDQSFELSYDNQGKPFLADPLYNISISHSGNYVCVLLNEKSAVGIDIQEFKSNIERGTALFMSAQELEDCGETLDNTRLHIYWGAKEAIYKFIGLTQTNIKNDIYISPFKLGTSGKLFGEILDEKPLVLKYVIEKEYVLVYTI